MSPEIRRLVIRRQYCCLFTRSIFFFLLSTHISKKWPTRTRRWLCSNQNAARKKFLCLVFVCCNYSSVKLNFTITKWTRRFYCFYIFLFDRPGTINVENLASRFFIAFQKWHQTSFQYRTYSQVSLFFSFFFFY